jgi:YebC/PmpR family DNA-binding regulatory protein
MGRAFEYRRAAKEKRWGQMSRIFPKLAKAITVAAKDGGPDSETNPKLRTAIQNAKAANMPKDNITAAIKRAEGKDADQLVETVFEGKGPHGVLVVVECATDNNNRTVANVKSYFNKSGGSLVPKGSLEFLFTRKSVFEIEKTEELNVDIEELELELIDAGLEEIEETEDRIYIYGGFSDFGTLSNAIDAQGLKVDSATLKRIANAPTSFTEEQILEIEKMLDKMEDDEDVQMVFTNIE